MAFHFLPRKLDDWAPKIEAMKVIDRLDAMHRRTCYGRLGYLDYHGRLNLGIVVWTAAIAKGGEACYLL